MVSLAPLCSPAPEGVEPAPSSVGNAWEAKGSSLSIAQWEQADSYLLAKQWSQKGPCSSLGFVCPTCTVSV